MVIITFLFYSINRFDTDNSVRAASINKDTTLRGLDTTHVGQPREKKSRELFFLKIVL